MKQINSLFISAILLALIGIATTLKCYECNVWKAGYGHLCDNPRIRDDCIACMKIQTVGFMGYYKSTPRKSSTISRVCVKSHTVHFSHECHRYQSSDGYNIRCFCDKDLCNSASRSYAYSKLTILPILVAVKLFFARFL